MVCDNECYHVYCWINIGSHIHRPVHVEAAAGVYIVVTPMLEAVMTPKHHIYHLQVVLEGIDPGSGVASGSDEVLFAPPEE